MHIFHYQLKLLLRDRIVMFWTFIFPIILATFFNFAFSKLNSSEMFEPAQLAIIEQKENIEFKSLIQELSKENDDQLLDVQYTSLSKAQELLKEEKIDGYLIINDTFKIYINKNGISQTIIKNVVDSYLQTRHSIETIAKLNPQKLKVIIQNKMNMQKDYFQSQNISSLDATVVYFYTLIGMACMYGSFFGLKISIHTEANLSRQGTRIHIAPTPKWKVMLTGTIAAFLCQYVSIILLFLYLVYGLNIAFGNMSEYILLLCAIGTCVGVLLGEFVGNAFHFNENIKTSILSASSLFLSFLSGMMVVDIKYLVQEYVPILGYINPVSLITDALYALYYYPTYERFYFNIFLLCIVALFLLVISILFLRRKQYDSL